MAEVKILKKGDLRTVETYCIQVSIFREAMIQVNKDGVINKYTSQNKITNIVKSPALAVAEKASEQILKYANSLGLTPAAWKRLDVKKEECSLERF
jgi:P27 family predicted phage terminase small subunit